MPGDHGDGGQRESDLRSQQCDYLAIGLTALRGCGDPDF